MDPVIVASMIFTLVVLLMIGGFITLLPITRRLGTLIEAKIREKNVSREEPDLTPLLDAVRSLEAEVRRMNERQEFTESLLAGRVQQPASVAGHSTAAADLPVAGPDRTLPGSHQ
jgi:hypothetical protein